MKIAKLAGDKTVTALARRIAKESSLKMPVKELSAALLRLNPHLQHIDRLDAGTPILLPESDGSAGSGIARGVMAARILQDAEAAIDALRGALKEAAGRSSGEIDQAHAWLKGEAGKLVLRELPDLKEDFAKTATAANEARKSSAAKLASQDKHLRKLHTELAAFAASVTGAAPRGPTGVSR